MLRLCMRRYESPLHIFLHPNVLQSQSLVYQKASIGSRDHAPSTTVAIDGLRWYSDIRSDDKMCHFTYLSPHLTDPCEQDSITLLIVLNTLVLATDHHPMDDRFATYLEGFNFAFSLCFMLEMVLKVRRTKSW